MTNPERTLHPEALEDLQGDAEAILLILAAIERGDRSPSNAANYINPIFERAKDQGTFQRLQEYLNQRT